MAETIEKQPVSIRTDIFYGLSRLGSSAIGFVISSLPYLFLDGRKDRKTAIGERIGVQRSLFLAFRSRVFLFFLIVWAGYLVTPSFVQSTMPFIVTEICLLNKADTVYFYVPGIIVSLIWYPLVTWFAKRWGKWKVYASSILISVFVFPGTMFVGDWLPTSMKVQCITWAVLQLGLISGVIVLISDFFAEIADYDFSLTGQHREDMDYAAIRVVEQLFNGLASILLTISCLLGRNQNSLRGSLGFQITGLLEEF